MTADKKSHLILFHLDTLYQYGLGEIDGEELEKRYGLFLKDIKEIEDE